MEASSIWPPECHWIWLCWPSRLMVFLALGTSWPPACLSSFQAPDYIESRLTSTCSMTQAQKPKGSWASRRALQGWDLFQRLRGFKTFPQCSTSCVSAHNSEISFKQGRLLCCSCWLPQTWTLFLPRTKYFHSVDHEYYMVQRCFIHRYVGLNIQWNHCKDLILPLLPAFSEMFALPASITRGSDAEMVSFEAIQLSTQGSERQRKDVPLLNIYLWNFICLNFLTLPVTYVFAMWSLRLWKYHSDSSNWCNSVASNLTALPWQTKTYSKRSSADTTRTRQTLLWNGGKWLQTKSKRYWE